MRGIFIFLDIFIKIKNTIRNKDPPLLTFSPPKPFNHHKKMSTLYEITPDLMLKMDGVNELDENGNISNLLDPDAENQTFGQKSQK
ncbi:hypothetical protein Hanom_Chr05g00472761 [Helianthus anomalus]